ncbi:RTG3 [Candida jiufengensis]|uniref:RTG3 n=1 Tax=Candida jiufengensis TaxID=497108 RepID=UPI002223FAFF|nr:RTG3 [Candida jiufengensis]KAI5951045.1 RTG3 [Candida jiufengensis]
MEQFLKDSPSDFSTFDEKSNFQSDNNNNNNNYNNQLNDQDLPNFTYNPINDDDINNSQSFGLKYEDDDQNNSGIRNDYSLNLDYSGDTNNNNNNNIQNVNNNLNFDQNYINSNDSGNYYNSSISNLNTSESGFNSNTQLSGSEYLSPNRYPNDQQQHQHQQQHQSSDSSNLYNQNSNLQQQQQSQLESNFAGSNPGSFTSEPFLDDMAFSQAILGPQLNIPQYSNNSNNFRESLSPQPLSPQLRSSSSQPFMNISNSANLDELISPGKNYDENSFLNPQYFSPPTRSSNNFNSLRSIAEDSYGNSDGNFNNNGNNVFSPTELSRHGSISGPSYNNNNQIPQSNSYISPQLNPSSYVSPDFNNGSYLNSPPRYSTQRINHLNLNQPASSTSQNQQQQEQQQQQQQQQMSSSIPNHASIKRENWSSLSPPPSQQSMLSTSVPNSSKHSKDTTTTNLSSAASSSSNIPTKQLSKEEKLKRRREFHNAVERRRRDLIKEKIKELGIIVPPSLLNPQLSAVQTLQRQQNIDSQDLQDLIGSIKVKETKPNKSTILNKSVIYMNHLNYVLKQQEIAKSKLIQQINQLESGTNGGGGGGSNWS